MERELGGDSFADNNELDQTTEQLSQTKCKDGVAVVEVHSGGLAVDCGAVKRATE